MPFSLNANSDEYVASNYVQDLIEHSQNQLNILKLLVEAKKPNKDLEV
jgi:hypothetical protein